MVEQVECIIIGAGVVGLACARAMALAGSEVIIIEANNAIGSEISARNSEVIHAGIYYPENSLKAVLCREGKELLYQYCESRGIPHKKLGKLIIATTEEDLKQLAQIEAKAKANGVYDLKKLSSQEVALLEPDIKACAGLLSPSTGIIDSHQLMLSLLGEAENAGAMLAVNSRVVSARINADDIQLSIDVQGEKSEIHAKKVINAAGLDAPLLLDKFENFPQKSLLKSYYCKGNYFSLAKKHSFNHLIYPVPNQAGLGVHLTLDMDGQARFGPDTQWVTERTFNVDETRIHEFVAAIQKYWPDIKASDLVPGYTGIRPKLVPEGQTAADFVIQGPEIHGVAGLVNLMGIESPGLTASLAIANRVKAMLSL